MIKKLIYLVLIALFVTGCNKDNVILSMFPTAVVNSSEIELRFVVTDDRSQTMNYTVFIDNVEKAKGMLYNNTMVEILLSLDQTKNSRIVMIKAVDEWGNVGTANVTVMTADVQSPVIQYIEIISK